MTKLLDQAVAAARILPDELQDEIARVMLNLAGNGQDVIELTPEEEASFEKSLAQAGRGEFATDEAVEAVWARYGL